MIEGFITDGTATLLALGVIAVELCLILGLSAVRRQMPSADIVASALSGLFLILALRAALLDHGAVPVALWLALAGAAHAGYMAARLRRT